MPVCCRRCVTRGPVNPLNPFKFALLGRCVPLSIWRTPSGFVAFSCCSRRRKEKSAEEDEIDLEVGVAGSDKGLSVVSIQDSEVPSTNGCILASAADVPAWQIPNLEVQCSRRPDARVHKGTSLILPEAGGDLLAGIVANLPVLLQIQPGWQLGYSMAVDGVSLRTMYRQMDDAGPCVLIVEDSHGCIFGAFLSEGLRPSNQCCGTHDCIMFRYPRAAGAWKTEVYRQAPPSSQSATVQGGDVERTEHCEALKNYQAIASPVCGAVFCDHTGIVVGIDGPGLFVDQDLLHGVSWPSKMFGSPCLPAVGSDFVVRNLEVWHWAN
eukprot:TRINITY_DN56008_c0_g1_i1.p1 TRINITY_DN56008_c0_g1~~TRINITY_DN56008_c0_g1_i1.p1  ORF type:complete len:340 (-),score=37.48 TRINITY_DN56008_c0_g1_i1:248-1216(-)